MGLNESDPEFEIDDANQSLLLMEKLNSISLQSDFMRALDNDMTFKLDGAQEASLDISTNSHLNVKIKAFNLTNYSEII